MQVLAIERFTDKKYEAISQKYIQQNQPELLELYNKGILRAYWSRADRPGTVMMIEADSTGHAKEILRSLSLVEQKIITYTILPLEPYQIQEFMPELAKKMIRLIYVSAEKYPITAQELQDILKKARRNNKKLGITGMLLYSMGSFLQILEGHEDAVLKLFETIKEDARHFRVAKIIIMKDVERAFSDWSMGFTSIKADDLKNIKGLNDFFKDKNCLADLNEEQVKKILVEFESGQWRQTLR